MGMSKKAIVILVPSLLFGIGAPAWSGTAEQAAPVDAQATPTGTNGNTLLGMLSSILTGTDPASRQPKSQCKASYVYSQHEVVGDPETCFMGRYTIGRRATVTGAP